VDLESSTLLVMDPRMHPAVEHGRVTLAVPHQPPGRQFTIGAGPYVIAVLGTRFHVRVAGDSVGVDVEEGVVEVRRGGRATRVLAGESWTSPSVVSEHRAVVASPAAVAVAPPPSPPPAADPRPIPTPVPAAAPKPRAPSGMEQFHEAQAALSQGHPERAVDMLETLAQGTGPAAENAAYEMGLILRDRLRRPDQAIAAWNRYRARFPQGILRAEADISVLETVMAQGDTARARTEAQGFLARHPDSERRAEVSALLERLR
jgi:hypothetical protein